jgi:hypothetical protein
VESVSPCLLHQGHRGPVVVWAGTIPKRQVGFRPDVQLVLRSSRHRPTAFVERVVVAHRIAKFNPLPDGPFQFSLATRRTFEAKGICGELARSLRKACIAARPAAKVLRFPMTARVSPDPLGAR